MYHFSPPSSPLSPLSPNPSLSPSDASPMSGHAAISLPPLITSFPPHSAIRRPSALQLNSPKTPYSCRQFTFTKHARYGSNGSTISSMDVLVSTPSSARPDKGNCLYYGSSASDGRQSRMDIRSPILERVLSLPLRVNTSVNRCTDIAMSNADCEHSSGNSYRENTDETSESRRAEINACSSTISRKSSSRVASSLSGKSSRSRSRIRKAKRTRSPPPNYHMTMIPSTAAALTRRAYSAHVSHLSTPLVPLISVTNGQPHPGFPRSLLQYHLLTHDQLDSLARWYHQVEPAVEATWHYPTCIPAWTSAAGDKVREVDLETKRRRWGRFIGMRGCDSPIVESGNQRGEQSNELGVDETQEEPEESLTERMEKEWRNALRRAEEERMLQEKTWMGRW